MSARVRTPALHDPYGGAGTTSAATSHIGPPVNVPDYAPTAGNPVETSPLAQSLNQNHFMGKFSEDFDASQRGSSIVDGDFASTSAAPGLQRNPSTASTTMNNSTPTSLSRSGTLKKRNSLSRRSSLKRSGSRRSLRAGSIKGVSMQDDSGSSDNHNSVFFTPVPTSGTPTEILANRFQAWRKLLKDLIAYFREVQTSYEQRAKALLKVSNVINNTNAPSVFLTEGGINEANRILRDYHKQAVVEANKARDIEIEVIAQLGGLRADLGSKIKEIKSLSGDFKNSVEKEKEGTRKAVAALEEALAAVDVDPGAVTGKGDPYVVRLAVDRQVEKQIDEENYLHRAYLNLEGSGRELESIVVGEVQKAYNALATILKKDADEAYSTVEKLRAGPIAMPKDHEWSELVRRDPHFVNPNLPLRQLEDIEYPGKHHPAAAEVRAGMLERKSKYLKSYTPGWYVLSPTHLHEFKSADRIYSQPPVMSLYLPEQKLGTHSQPGSSSHKFVLKGRQTGTMHRGHSWVFRAESYDTMMAWYEDIKSLTEKSGEERNNFVRRHTRSTSAASTRSVSDSGMEEDEADEVPYSASNSMVSQPEKEQPPKRPSPGGRFPSDVQLNGHLQAPLSPSSGSSDVGDHDLTTASGGPQGHAYGYGVPYAAGYPHHDGMPPHPETQQPAQPAYGQPERVYEAHGQHPQTYPPQAPQSVPAMAHGYPQTQLQHPQPVHPIPPAQAYPQTYTQVPPASSFHNLPPVQSDSRQRNSNYGEWFGPAAAGVGVAAGVAGVGMYQQQQQRAAAEAEIRRTPQPIPVTQQLMQNSQNSALPPSAAVALAPGPAPIPSNPVELPLATPNSMATTDSNFTNIDSVGGDSSVGYGQPPWGIVTPTVSNAKDYMSAGGAAAAQRGDPIPDPLRRNTGVSLSDLHVPGEFPKRGAASP